MQKKGEEEEDALELTTKEEANLLDFDEIEKQEERTIATAASTTTTNKSASGKEWVRFYGKDMNQGLSFLECE